MINKTLFILVMIGLIGLSGCGIVRKWQIESELEQLKPQKELSEQRLYSLKQKINSLQSQSKKLITDLNANHSETIMFVRNHPGVVTCIASGFIAMDEGNLFSKDIEEIGAGVGLVCLGIYIFNEDFQKSVDNFLAELNEASERQKNLQYQADSLKTKINTEIHAWQSEKKSLDELTKKIADLELELDKLK